LSKGSGITRGDRRRNARKARLRALVPHENAVAGLDLGEKKQALAVTGGDGQVLARRSPQVSVHDLGPCLDWAAGQARAAGYAGLSVACEPTGSWWMAVQDLCQARGLPFVCVQPLVSHVAREQEDLTGDKTDPLTELPGEVPQVSGRMGVLVATVADHDHRRRCAAGPVPAGDAARRVA
jgi:transposase